MISSRLLNLESIEDRMVPAAISISYLGSTFVVLSNTSGQSDHGRVSTPTVTRAEVFRVISDDGSTQYLLRTANWAGNWNQYLAPSTRAATVSPSTVKVPYAPNYRADASENSGVANRANSQSQNEVASKPESTEISVPFGISSTGTRLAANSDLTGSQSTSDSSLPTSTPQQIDSGSGISRRNLPLVGSLDVVENPLGSVPMTPAEQPANNGQLLSESAEPALADVLPVVATQLANAMPLTGLLPFHFDELESGVRNVLDRVANLDETWVEEASGMEDYLWITAGALVAGGVLQAAWSRRNQLSDRRVLGLDSVLARWGSPYDGRLGG